MELVSYKGWDNCVRLSNGETELIITTDVGPRVIRCGFIGGRNVFKEYKEMLGKSGEKQWMIRGGHRLWVAPESKESYALDNSPVSFKKKGANGVVLTSKPDTKSGWTKEIEIALNPKKNEATVLHRLIPTKDAKQYWALWALSVMAPGGTAIIPQPPFLPHLSVPPTSKTPPNLRPDRKLILWPYTDLRDKRYQWGKENLCVKQNAKKGPTKIGLLYDKKWVGYHLKDTLFAKTVDLVKKTHYPDNGVNFELFTNEDMLEVESLAPLTLFKKGEAVIHKETWKLVKSDVKDWKDVNLTEKLS